MKEKSALMKWIDSLAGNEWTKFGRFMNNSGSIGDLIFYDFEVTAYSGIIAGLFPYHSPLVYQANV